MYKSIKAQTKDKNLNHKLKIKIMEKIEHIWLCKFIQAPLKIEYPRKGSPNLPTSLRQDPRNAAGFFDLNLPDDFYT